MKKIKNQSLLRGAGYVRGEWCGADGGAFFGVDNPATGEVIANVPQMGAAETRRAIDAAAAAFAKWRVIPAKERAAFVMEWYRMILENADDLARLMTLEQGKPLAESRGEVLYGASFAQWFAEECKRGGGEIVPAPRTQTQIRITREAAGVAALITPWNFPIAMIMRKAAPALAAGCTVVAKPASQTPLCAIALAALAEKAGFPAGVFNLITGDARAVGGELCANPAVRVLSFTGSTEVGRLLAAACAPDVKKLALELGGNAPFIVFDDADLSRAAAQLMASKFRNAGQTCVCANRVYVQRGVYDEFAEIMKEKVLALKVGDGLEAGVDIGPLIDDSAVQKAENHLRGCESGGANVIVRGGRTDAGARFFAPALLGNVPDGAPPCREETFAPLAPLFIFDDETEVVRRANDTIYGLSAYLCTRDLGRAMRVSESLESGIVGVNEGIISTEVAPFGGVKQSGIGREGGAHGMDEYTETKYTLFGY